ncbi:MAG: urease accessory protein UreD [Actinomycetota bacterium]
MADRADRFVGRARPGRTLTTMRSSSHVVAELSGGITRLIHMRSEAPLLLRPTPGGLYLVGGAAGPLGGDEARLRIEVGPGAQLSVHSTAASVALPGRLGQPSRLRIDATVAEGAELRWLTEPTILAGGCRHHIQCAVHVSADARLVWREELILGRHGERPGSGSSRMDCVIEAQPVYRNEQVIAGRSRGWDGPAAVGSAKAVGSLLVAAPHLAGQPAQPKILSQTAAIMPLAGPAALASALADDSLVLRTYLDQALDRLTDAAAVDLSA